VTDVAAAAPTPTAPPPSAWVQAIDLAFVAVFLVVAGLAVLWVASGIRQVGPGTQAVVSRFGAVVAGHGPGLLVTWPAPIARVDIVPGPDRLIEVPLSRFGAGEPPDLAAVLDPRRNTAFVLTGDVGLVRLEATLLYTITVPSAWLLARDRLGPALDRLAAASLAAVAAGSDLDGVMVARPEAPASAAAAARREALRGAVVAGINRRLQALEDQGAGLGIRVARLDLSAALPAVLAPVYQDVLSAVQRAEQVVAEARTAAAGIGQAADRLHIQILRQAEGAAVQRVAAARSRTAGLLALAAHAEELPRAPVLERVFRERIGAILEQAGSVTTVEPGMTPKLILPGTPP
jgi:regulator of protease activity HflC (stomatin/prohibitin superfamily)